MVGPPLSASGGSGIGPVPILLLPGVVSCTGTPPVAPIRLKSASNGETADGPWPRSAPPVLSATMVLRSETWSGPSYPGGVPS